MELIVMRDQPILQCEKFDYTRDPESKQWEVFAMTDYDPADPLWAAEEEESPPAPGSQKTASAPPKSTAVPSRHKEEKAADPEPAPAGSGDAREEKEEDEEELQTVPPENPQSPEEFRRRQYQSEKNAMEFMRKQASQRKASGNPDLQDAPQSSAGENDQPAAHGRIPGPQRPPARKETPEIAPRVESAKNTGITGTRKPPKL